MFKKLASLFGTGLVTVLPFALVIWVLIAIFQWVDGLLGQGVNNLSIMGVHIPGAGFILVILGIMLAGLLTRVYISHRVYLLMDALFARIPLVKSLYSMFKELVESLVRQRKGFSRVVLLEWPDERALVLGLVTRERLPIEIDPSGLLIAVYLPNTFQFAGLTVFVNRNRAHPCHLTVEEAFKFTVSGGLGQHNGPFPGGKPETARSPVPVADEANAPRPT